MACDESGKEYEDNGERAVFFARGVLETVKKLRWTPDIIHCQGWMSAIVPIYVKLAYSNEPTFANTKIVTSIFKDKLENSIGQNFKKSLELRNVSAETLGAYRDDFDFTELGKLAIDYSDAVIEAEENANASLIQYAIDNKKDVLRHSADNYIDSYKSLYEKILSAK